MHNYMAGGIGYRWYGSWTTNILLGFENSRLINAAMQQGTQGQRFRGLYAQLALIKFLGDKNIEYILSYSEDSKQIWSRFRLKFYTPNFLLGPEISASRFLENDYQGLGVIIEKVIASYTVTAKSGVRNQTNFITTYGGLELYLPF